MGVYRKYSHARLMMGAAVGALMLGANAAYAEARPISIPAQTLASALHDFGAQTGRQIMFTPESAQAKMTRGVDGATDEETALAQLLQGTGLTFRREANIYLIVKADDGPQSSGAAGDGAEVEALIVTAQKREEDIQDVPIAISAFTQEALERSQVAGGPDLITQVPNMSFTKTNFSSYSIQLRGIGTQAISATTDPAVAVAFNNTPFVRNRFFEQEFYDLQRVEVLRGPQGTLYGRNATAGVVNIISQKPKFDYEAKLSADIANYSSKRLEGMINVPLVDDLVALRVAGAWTKRDGFVQNEITGEPIDGRNLWSTRVSLRFTPTDALDANLIWEHFEEDDDRLRSGKQVCHRHVPTEIGGLAVPPPGGSFSVHEYLSQGCTGASMYAPESYEAPNGYSLPFYHPLGALTFYNVPDLDPYASITQSRDLRVIESTLTPEYRAKADLVELQVNYDLTDNLTLASETSYSTDRLFSFQDYNRFNTTSGAWRTDRQPGQTSYRENLIVNGEFCDPQLGCADRMVAADVSTAKSVQFSQELRLGSDYDGPFNFSLGANFLRYDTEDKYYVFINSLTLWAASRTTQFRDFGGPPPWIPNVSDNHECLAPDGPREPEFDRVYEPTNCIYIDPNPIGSLNDEGHNYFLSRNPYKLISYAVFGEAYYNLAENLKVTAGLRWTVDKKEAPRIPSWVVGSETVGYPVEEVSEQEWREPTGRLTIDWKPDLAFTNETLLYASYAHGYKAGGANPPAAGMVVYGVTEVAEAHRAQSAAKPKTFNPEFIDAFELGAKNTLFDGSLTLNAAAFYYDYKDYQVSYITDRSAVNLNFDSEVWGAELEADWRPLENLRFGLKLGYQQSKVADGEHAIDVMDRTAGRADWITIRPHPSRSNNCIFPVAPLLDLNSGTVMAPAPTWSAGPTGCEILWLLHTPFRGFDPLPWLEETNNGEGFFKDLSGNELPNAPHYTATLTADYTVPLPNSWLATLHTDLYYQSEAWTRIFNTEGYDKLKAYTNVNLAAIFTNEERGWKVMAYVKNVMDRDSITGAFLNSDDTGLTTNVFLTEPRLYGLRVTKEFSGGPWWTGAGRAARGPFPLTVEIGGQVQRHDAPNETLTPSFAGEFNDRLNTLDEAQHTDLDWGDGRDLKLTVRPSRGPWTVSAAIRYGRTNGSGPRLRTEEESEPGCLFGEPLIYICDLYPDRPSYLLTHTNWSRNYARHQEEHQFIDFAVGRDVALGGLDGAVGVGVRFARLKSRSTFEALGTPDWYIPDGWFYAPYSPTGKYDATHSFHEARFDAHRKFEGAGLVVSWEAAQALWGDDDRGHLSVDWTVGGGVLFGSQDTSITGAEQTSLYAVSGNPLFSGGNTIEGKSAPESIVTTPINIRRSTSSVTVPLLDLSLGLSYKVGRIKVGAGYRWERYFDVLDAGYEEHQDADRTIDGPYFKIAVGFGG